MTTIKLEQVLCASVMDEPTAKLSPNVCTAFGFAPDYWEGVEARIVAAGIKEAMNNRRPTHREVVRRYLPLDYQDWIDHPCFKDGLPLSCIDHQVTDLLRVYETKRIARMIERAHGDILWGADARQVAERLRSELEGVL